MHYAIIILFCGIIIALLIYAYLKFITFKCLVLPNRHYVWEPSYPYDNLNIDGITGWYFHEFLDAPTILYCHGNAGNISHRAYIIKLAHSQGINILMFDYNGFGKSGGFFSDKEFLQNGEKIYQFLASQISYDKIIICGESLGGNCASYLASKYPCSRLILWSTFSSLYSAILANKEMPYLMKQVVLLANYFLGGFDNISLLKNVKCPITVVHSTEDTLIDYSNAKELYDSLLGDKKIVTIKGDHSSPQLTEEDVHEIFPEVNMRHKITLCKILRAIHEVPIRNNALSSDTYQLPDITTESTTRTINF